MEYKRFVKSVLVCIAILLFVISCARNTKTAILDFCFIANGPALYYEGDKDAEKKWKDEYNVAWQTLCEGK